MSGPAVRTIRARAKRWGYQLRVRGGHAELYDGNQLVMAAPLEAVNAFLVDRLTQDRRPPGPPPMPTPEEWEIVCAPYLAELEAAHRTPQTIATRMSHVTTFAREIATPPGQVSRDQLVAYIGRPGRAQRTAHGIRSSLRDLFAFMAAHGIRPDNPAVDLPCIRQARSRPRPCPDQAVREALAVADERGRLAIRILVETGLRRAEVAQLERDSVIGEPGRHALHIVGKGGHQRIVPVTDELAVAILSAPGRYVFPSRAGGHISPRYLGKVVSNALPGRFTAHTVRHRFATRAYQASGDLRAVQELLGHSSPVTTATYTAVSDDSMRAAAMAAILADD